MHEELRLLKSARGPDAPVTALDRARSWDDADRAGERDAAARADRAAGRHEQMATADRMFGGPAAEIARCRSRLEKLDDDVAEAEAVLARAAARRDQVRSSLAWWTDRATLADDMVRRSASPDPLEAASARAADAFRELREGRTVVERSRRGLRFR